MVCVAGETSKKVLFPSDTPSLPGELPELKRKGGGGGGGEGGEEEGEGEGKLSRTGWMDGRADGRTSDIEGSIRGPRGPKK